MTDKRKLEEENSKKPGKTPAKPAAKPEKKAPAKKRTMKAVPILWEAAFSGSMAIIVILGAVVSLLSFLVGCDPWTVLLRGLVTILADIFWSVFFQPGVCPDLAGMGNAGHS